MVGKLIYKRGYCHPRTFSPLKRSRLSSSCPAAAAVAAAAPFLLLLLLLLLLLFLLSPSRHQWWEEERPRRACRTGTAQRRKKYSSYPGITLRTARGIGRTACAPRRRLRILKIRCARIPISPGTPQRGGRRVYARGARRLRGCN